MITNQLQLTKKKERRSNSPPDRGNNEASHKETGIPDAIILSMDLKQDIKLKTVLKQQPKLKQQLFSLNPKLALIILSAVLLMSCNGKKFESNSTDIPTEPAVSDKYTGLSFKFSSMPGTSSYAYTYTIDFQAMTIKVQTSTVGTLNVTLPTQGSRTLSVEQLKNIKSLLNNLSYQSCMEGPKVLGGSTDSLSLYTSTLSEPEATITSQCTGMETIPSSVALGGLQEVISYIKSL